MQYGWTLMISATLMIQRLFQPKLMLGAVLILRLP
jgi:hypothetical protein